jgi:hypothetical protein
VNAFVKAASSLEVVDKMFKRKFNANSSVFYATLFGSLAFMVFLMFAMTVQEQMTKRVKKMFRHFPSSIPDPDKKRN